MVAARRSLSLVQHDPQEPGGTAAAALAAFLRVTEAVDDLGDREVVLRQIGVELCALVGASRCSVYVRDAQRSTFVGSVGRARHDIDARVRRLVAGTPGDRFTQEIVATGRPVLVPDARHDPRPIRATMAAWDVDAMLGVPLVHRDEVRAIVYLDHEEAGATFRPGCVELAHAFAGLAASLVAHADAAESLAEELRRARSSVASSRRAAGADERLHDALHEDDTPAALLRVAAELTSRPLVLLDRAWTRRLDATAPAGAAARRIPDLDRPELQADRAFRDAVRPLRPGDVLPIGPFLSGGLHRRVLVAPLPDDGGWVVLGDDHRRFTTHDAHVLRRVASLVGATRALADRVRRTERASPAQLAGELVGDDVPAERARSAGRALGLELSASHVVALVAGRDGAPTPGAPEDLDGALPGAVAVGVPRGTAVVVPLRGALPREVADGLATVLARAGAADGTIVAVSAPSAAADGLAAARADAETVLDCARGFVPAGAPCALTADEIGPARHFLGSTDPERTIREARRTLAPLRPGGGLDATALETAEAFLAAGRHARAAAAALGIHHNTLRYRLAKFERETGRLVLSDPQDQLAVELALVVLRLRGETGAKASAVRPARASGPRSA